MYIYKITNIVNNKIYIGKTTKTIQERFKEHCHDAKFKPDTYLHKAMNKYGIENFIVEEIEECSTEDELNQKERYYIEKYNSINSEIGYNIHEGGKGGNTRSKDYQNTQKQLDALEYGRHLPSSEKQKSELAKRRKNCVVKESTREKLRIKSSGKHHSEETRIKMGKAHKGVKMPERSKLQRERYKNASSDRVHIHKETINKNPKRSDLDKYLNDGWELGYYYK